MRTKINKIISDQSCCHPANLTLTWGGAGRAAIILSHTTLHFCAFGTLLNTTVKAGPSRVVSAHTASKLRSPISHAVCNRLRRQLLQPANLKHETERVLNEPATLTHSLPVSVLASPTNCWSSGCWATALVPNECFLLSASGVERSGAGWPSKVRASHCPGGQARIAWSRAPLGPSAPPAPALAGTGPDAKTETGAGHVAASEAAASHF